MGKKRIFSPRNAKGIKKNQTGLLSRRLGPTMRIDYPLNHVKGVFPTKSLGQRERRQ